MRILGIDPGTIICGYGVIELAGGRPEVIGYGIIRAETPEARTLPLRLQRIYRGLGQVIAAYAPAALALEEAFVWKNARSALAIGHGRAAAMLAAAEHALPVHEYQPALIKKAVTGSGRAPKEQVQAMVRALLGLAATPHPPDAADALAVAFAHLHRLRLDALADRARERPRRATTGGARAGAAEE